mgnify:CR=1 FL=1
MYREARRNAGQPCKAWIRFPVKIEHPSLKAEFAKGNTDNPFIESFNGSFRDECLNLNWFLSLDDAQRKVEAWRVDYNEHRPHQSLNDRTPQEFATEHQQAEFL